MKKCSDEKIKIDGAQAGKSEHSPFILSFRIGLKAR
jgi:hypothetical protein